jgi:hypothetical protein
LRRYRGNDAARDIVLHIEHVGQRPVEALAPHLRAARRLDQLRSHADTVPCAADASLQQVLGPECRPDTLRVAFASAHGEARVARDHQQPLEPRHRGDDLLGDAVGKIVLRSVFAQVRERQDRERRAVRRGRVLRERSLCRSDRRRLLAG